MDSKKITKELEKVLVRYRAGLISQEQARQELDILVTILKAYDTVVLETRIQQLEAVLEGRR